MRIDELLFLIIIVLVFMMFCVEVAWYIKYSMSHPVPRSLKKQCPHGYEDWDECPDCCH
jgi:hypothetical protein